MISYKISTHNAHRHFIQFEMTIPSMGLELLKIQLPSWRPGRYELANFAKNIRAFESFDKDGNKLKFKKLKKDLWQIQNPSKRGIVVRYEYYANELNGGSTYLDENQLYINPVNCMFYLPEKEDIPYELNFELPSNYRIATGMEKIGDHNLSATDYQELFDCPLIASPDLKHLDYTVGNVKFNIWIQGEIHVEDFQFIKDHKDFTIKQVEAFGDIPCQEYHFLYQFPTTRVQHGVEHCNSTVIAMGPSDGLHHPSQYSELIGISCHELYHTWNIKSIRPEEMMPYDFSKENYSEMGYVAEGVTTYFGDQFLWRSDFFTTEEFFAIIRKAVGRYMQNHGRFNYSVAESSFDTWLDGYVMGIPWRKVSIYNEGMLLALICDLRILRISNGDSSLDDVMKHMYLEFGKKGRGYTEEDYWSAIEKISGSAFTDLYEGLAHGTEDYIAFLQRELEFFGVQLELIPNKRLFSAKFGVITDDQQKVLLIAPDSPADKSGIWVGDQIMGVNGLKAKHSLSQMIDKECNSVVLVVRRKDRIHDFTLKSDRDDYFQECEISMTDKANMKLISSWKRTDL